MQETLAAYFGERLSAARDTTRIDWLGLYLLDPKRAMASLYAYSGGSPTYRQFSYGFGPIGRCAADGSPQTRSGPSDGSALAEGEGYVSQAVFPVGFNGEWVAVLDAESRRAGATEDPGVQEHLIALASQLGTVAHQPVPEYAVLLDRRVEQLQRENAHFHWCGVYKLVKQTLYLAAFRGAPSLHAVISRESGICGAAVRENRTLNIPDVSRDERYLSCDSRTRSEIVVPIRNDDGEAIGEIDIDSHVLGAFDSRDAAKLQAVAEDLAPLVVNLI